MDCENEPRAVRMFSRIQHVRIYKYIYTYDEDTVFAQLIRLCVGITAIAATQLTTNRQRALCPLSPSAVEAMDSQLVFSYVINLDLPVIAVSLPFSCFARLWASNVARRSVCRLRAVQTTCRLHIYSREA